MAKVEIEKPKIITFSFRQEKGDADYGTCLWAKFYFDTQSYTMFVESDCGGYSYGWVPTPKSETFLHLMARCNSDYILGKIASRSSIDELATFDSVQNQLGIYGYDQDTLPDYTWDEIRRACSCSDNAQEVIDGIYDALASTDAEAPNDEYDFWECIETDYPNRAKKIAEIFGQHIRPAIREMEKAYG